MPPVHPPDIRSKATQFKQAPIVRLVKINDTTPHLLRIYCLIIQYVLNCLHLYLTESNSQNNAVH